MRKTWFLSTSCSPPGTLTDSTSCSLTGAFFALGVFVAGFALTLLSGFLAGDAVRVEARRSVRLDEAGAPGVAGKGFPDKTRRTSFKPNVSSER